MKTLTRTLQISAIASLLVFVVDADVKLDPEIIEKVQDAEKVERDQEIEDAEVEVRTITETYAKINAECDFKISDARSIDLLQFVSVNQVPIDVSEVEDILEEENITLTMKPDTWMDIVTHTADKIDASVLIGKGSIKLIPNKKEEVDKDAE